MAMMAMVVELGYYLSTLLGFYGYLIPKIGTEIKEKCVTHPWCNHQLKKTIFNYRVDLSDGQWREFRESLPLLIGTAILGVMLHSLFRRLKENSTASSVFKSTHFHLLFGSIVLVVQHGWHSSVIFLIAGGAYLLTKTFRHMRETYFLAIVYLYGFLIILLKESYRLQHKPQFEFLQVLFNKRYSGLYSWHVPANFLVLRIISFMLDYYWAQVAEQDIKKTDESGDDGDHDGDDGGDNSRGDDNVKVSKESIITKDIVTNNGCKQKSSTARYVSDHCAMHDYNLVNFLSYCVYAPLYIAGPIITFNAYIKYSNQPQKSESVATYALRWIFAFCLMEFGISYFPFFAIINTGLYKDLSAPQLAILAYCTLKLMWLKFLLIWRFFRWWALADGVLPPENQVRCMSNNQSIGQFWKGWHASFNLWLVRYMYVPLGGRAKGWLNVWPIFLFVAVWHDIEPKLLLWGALNAGFYVIEMMGREIGKSSWMAEKVPRAIRGLLQTVGAASFIMVLIAVNMTGYAVGGEGVHFMLAKMLTWDGAATVFWSFYFLSSGVCIMNFLKEKKISK